MRRAWWTVLTAAALTLATVIPAAASAGTAPAAAPAQVRVNQVGYPVSGPKVAFAMLARPSATVRFEVTTPYGVAYRGTSTDDVGAWNSAYRAVYRLDFSGVKTAGVYQVRLLSPAAAVSPAFAIGSGSQLYRQLVDNAVRYFTSERDGPDTDAAVLDRQPANLTDERAYVYADPRYDDNDNLLGSLRRIGGPVDVSGGWFDAGGGYEKFAYTASYADALMLIAARDNPGAYPALLPEAEFGLQWIGKLWNPTQKVMYVQVGIGNGNASNTIQGDYNFWFLPQQEDRMNVGPAGNPGPTAYYVKYRPVFEAAPPGQPVSPDLAGRFAADFALGAQLAAADGDAAQAQHLLALARGVYAMAKTTDVGQIVTAFPHDYYPGTEWKSDMLWGAAEIALADEATGAQPARLQADLVTAARWARAYVAQGHPADGDTFNLYDNGAVAEAELLQAMRAAGGTPVIAPGVLLGDLAAQLRTGEDRASGDPVFPRCTQSEIANLAGSLTGAGDIQLGATTDGPSSPGNFVGLGTVTGMRACSAGNYAPFDTAAAAYEDNVVSWPSVEPADDYTAASLLAFALGGAGLG